MADLIFDPWAGFDHKDLSKVGKLPSYVKADDDVRRLTAYRVAQAYIENEARLLLPDDGQHAEDDLQEFGDPGVLVERVAAAVLGEAPLVGVIGADNQVPDAPDLPDRPVEPESDGIDPRMVAVLQRVYETAVTRWVEESTALVDEWEALAASTPDLLIRQEWLQNWAASERLMGKLQENEVENVVGLGDGVIALGWDPIKNRVKVEVIEPEKYFPALDAGEVAQFPDKVHLVFAYEGLEDGDDEPVEYVRRVTYELVPVEEAEEVAAALYLGEGETQTHVCLHTDATWLAEDFDDVYEPATPPKFFEPLGVADSEELITLDRYNTGYDFIPVIHLGNTQSTRHHFGRSLLARLGQLLDEISASDTDESLSSRWAARPPVIIDGLQAGTDTINLSPGQGISGKSADTIEMAQNLAVIGLRGIALQKRLSVNSQVPDGLRGRVDASDVPSGLALTLSFTPFVQLIGRLREARGAVLPLLLKFVQRIAIQNGELSGIDSAIVHDAEVRFGAFMPQDLLGSAEIIARLYNAKLISLETALAELKTNGLTIDDLAGEIAKIRETEIGRAHV